MTVNRSVEKSQLALIFLTIFIYLAGFGLAIPIMPLLAKDFGASPLQVGLLMSVYSLMQFLFAPFWGRLSDRLGRRPILVSCLIGESISYLIFAWSRSLEWLFVARALGGFFGGSISTASAYISDVTTEENRSKGMAIIGVAFGLGFLVGPALGGFLTLWGEKISDAPHFATSFAALFVAGFCFVASCFAFFFLKESLHTRGAQVTARKLSRIFEYLQRPVVGPLILIFFLGSLSMSTMEATLVLLVKDKFNWDLKTVSFGFAYVGLISVLSQGFLVRRLLPILGERKMMFMGLAIMSASFFYIGWIPNIYWMALSMTGIAVGNSFANPSIMGGISLAAGASEQGAALGSAQGTASLGRILGPALGGLMFQSWSTWSPFVVSSLMAALAVFLITKNYSRIPNSAKRS